MEKTLDQKVKEIVKENKLSVKNIIDIDALDKADIKKIFAVADFFREHFRRGKDKKITQLKGRSIINFFFESSTRTRTSFELAGKHLGADTINVTGASAVIKTKGETLIDTAKTLNSLQADLIILRHAKAGTPLLLTKWIEAPVISAGDGFHQHPTQTLIDVYTMQNEFGDLKNKKVTIVGDIKHSRVAGSLMRLLERYKATVVLTGPQTLMPENVEEAFNVTVDTNAEHAFKDSDVLYNIRVQKERGSGSHIPSLREYAHMYCINEARFALAKKNAIVMDAGPVNREIGIRSEVLDGLMSRVSTQVENGLFIRLAVLSLLIS
ncbi:aspartate carbamoyltransferase catalytic subunit [Patescibacteria group bacterium]|nr:aspartate carbamoyltransferase catalytic subunit [Patescibacteria group bacterium]